MDITKNHENPDNIKEKPVPEVAAEDDPTIPEEEKAKAKEQAEAEKTPETQKEPAKKKTETMEVHVNVFDKLLLALLDIKNQMYRQGNEIAEIRSRYDIVQEIAGQLQINATDISNKIQNISKLTDTNKTLANKVENMEIKWNLTFRPITPEEIAENMNDTNTYKEYWNELNNIITAIYNLKTKVSDELDKQAAKKGSKEYREIYKIALYMDRIFNEYPPQLKYFGRKRKDKKDWKNPEKPDYEDHENWLDLEITAEQAKLIDVSESQTIDEQMEKFKAMGY